MNMRSWRAVAVGGMALVWVLVCSTGVRVAYTAAGRQDATPSSTSPALTKTVSHRGDAASRAGGHTVTVGDAPGATTATTGPDDRDSSPDGLVPYGPYTSRYDDSVGSDPWNWDVEQRSDGKWHLEPYVVIMFMLSSFTVGVAIGKLLQGRRRSLPTTQDVINSGPSRERPPPRPPGLRPRSGTRPEDDDSRP